MSAVVYGIILECFHTSQVISLCIFDPSTRTSTIWKAWLVPHFWLPKAWYLMISVRAFFGGPFWWSDLMKIFANCYCWWWKEMRRENQLMLVVYVTIYKVLYITGGGFPDCWTINSIRHTMWKNPYPKDFEDLPWWRCLTMGQVPLFHCEWEYMEPYLKPSNVAGQPTLATGSWLFQLGSRIIQSKKTIGTSIKIQERWLLAWCFPTVDGSEIRRSAVDMENLTFFLRVLSISGGAGFLNHQQ